MTTLQNNLQNFIENNTWTFAKTYADTWAHWYIVKEQVDNELFLELANFIDNNGYQEDFYSKQMTFFDYRENTYWHMGDIINRCLLADTYHRRIIDGRLPKEKISIDTQQQKPYSPQTASCSEDN